MAKCDCVKRKCKIIDECYGEYDIEFPPCSALLEEKFSAHNTGSPKLRCTCEWMFHDAIWYCTEDEDCPVHGVSQLRPCGKR